MNDDQTHQVQRFFDAIDNVMLEKFEATRRAISRLTTPNHYYCEGIPLEARYTLNDGVTWEPYEDKKNNVSGWRPIRRRTIGDWFYRRKHGHDKDFVKQLPEGPTRCPANFLEELWAWNQSINPAIHYLMLMQEQQRFQSFALLAHILEPKLLQGTMRYEDARTFKNSMAYDMGCMIKNSIHWNSIERFHQEVMDMMNRTP